MIEAVRGKGLAEIEKKAPENKRAAAKEVINDGADLLQKIVKSGHVDGAATVLVGPKAATGLLAGYVADGACWTRSCTRSSKPSSRTTRKSSSS